MAPSIFLCIHIHTFPLYKVANTVPVRITLATVVPERGSQERCALRGSGLGEGVSTRLLVYAGQLMANGVPARRACTVAVTNSLTDDPEMLRAVGEVVTALFA